MRMFTMTGLAAVAACATVLPTHGAVPTYSDIELQVRSNLTVNGGGFNLAGDASFSNTTAAIDDSGRVAIRVIGLAGFTREGVWFGPGDGTGSVVFESPSGASVSDCTMNELGVIAFTQSFTSPDGIFTYDTNTASSGLFTDRPIGATGWAAPTINDAGDIGFRTSFSGDNAYHVDNGASAVLVAAEADLVVASPYSFLFTPTFDESSRIAAKVRLGLAGQFGNNQPDEIRLFEPDGMTSTLIAVDDDGDPMSPYTSFDNSVAVTDGGRVAFVAGLAGGERGVFVSDGTTTTEIATTLDTDVSDIEFFAPDVNASGVVVFRGRDGTGTQAVFAGDGTDLIVVARASDELMTDLGLAQLAQHDGATVFGGGPAINAAGAITFQAAVTPATDNQIEWGTGLFVAKPDLACLGDLDGSGSIGFGDLTDLLAAWGPCDGKCPADLDSSGTVGFSDLTVLLGAWGACA